MSISPLNSPTHPIVNTGTGAPDASLNTAVPSAGDSVFGSDIDAVFAAFNHSTAVEVIEENLDLGQAPGTPPHTQPDATSQDPTPVGSPLGSPLRNTQDAVEAEVDGGFDLIDFGSSSSSSTVASTAPETEVNSQSSSSSSTSSSSTSSSSSSTSSSSSSTSSSSSSTSSSSSSSVTFEDLLAHLDNALPYMQSSSSVVTPALVQNDPTNNVPPTPLPRPEQTSVQQTNVQPSVIADQQPRVDQQPLLQDALDDFVFGDEDRIPSPPPYVSGSSSSSSSSRAPRSREELAQDAAAKLAGSRSASRSVSAESSNKPSSEELARAAAEKLSQTKSSSSSSRSAERRQSRSSRSEASSSTPVFESPAHAAAWKLSQVKGSSSSTSRRAESSRVEAPEVQEFSFDQEPVFLAPKKQCEEALKLLDKKKISASSERIPAKIEQALNLLDDTVRTAVIDEVAEQLDIKPEKVAARLANKHTKQRTANLVAVREALETLVAIYTIKPPVAAPVQESRVDEDTDY